MYRHGIQTSSWLIRTRICFNPSLHCTKRLSDTTVNHHREYDWGDIGSSLRQTQTIITQTYLQLHGVLPPLHKGYYSPLPPWNSLRKTPGSRKSSLSSYFGSQVKQVSTRIPITTISTPNCSLQPQAQIVHIRVGEGTTTSSGLLERFHSISNPSFHSSCRNKEIMAGKSGEWNACNARNKRRKR